MDCWEWPEEEAQPKEQRRSYTMYLWSSLQARENQKQSISLLADFDCCAKSKNIRAAQMADCTSENPRIC